MEFVLHALITQTSGLGKRETRPKNLQLFTHQRLQLCCVQPSI